MRCKICQIPHKNTARFQSWEEQQICRICNEYVNIFLGMEIIYMNIGGMEIELP